LSPWFRRKKKQEATEQPATVVAPPAPQPEQAEPTSAAAPADAAWGWADELTPRLAEVLQVLNELFDGGAALEASDTACPAA